MKKLYLITGATGLIGSLLVRTLQRFNEEKQGNVRISVLVRDRAKAEALFGGSEVNYLIGSVEQGISETDFDFVVHCASPTRSRFFVEKPVETCDTIVRGTRQMLESLKNSRTFASKAGKSDCLKKLLAEVRGTLYTDNAFISKIKEEDLVEKLGMFDKMAIKKKLK